MESNENRIPKRWKPSQFKLSHCTPKLFNECLPIIPLPFKIYDLERRIKLHFMFVQNCYWTQRDRKTLWWSEVKLSPPNDIEVKWMNEKSHMIFIIQNLNMMQLRDNFCSSLVQFFCFFFFLLMRSSLHTFQDWCTVYIVHTLLAHLQFCNFAC